MSEFHACESCVKNVLQSLDRSVIQSLEEDIQEMKEGLKDMDGHLKKLNEEKIKGAEVVLSNVKRFQLHMYNQL